VSLERVALFFGLFVCLWLDSMFSGADSGRQTEATVETLSYLSYTPDGSENVPLTVDSQSYVLKIS
jgi:hypothetical protein